MQIIFHQHLSYLLILSIALLILFNPVDGYAEENKSSSSNSSEESLSDLDLIHDMLETLDDEINTIKNNRKRRHIKTFLKISKLIELIEQNLASLTTKIESSKKKINVNRSTLKDIKEIISDIQANIEEAQTNVEDNNKAAHEIEEMVLENIDQIKANAVEVDEKLTSKKREIETNATSITELKGLIEDNAVRMYETLTKIKGVSEDVNKLAEELDLVSQAGYIEKITQDVNHSVNKLWDLITIVLVFFVPVAFALYNNQNAYKSLDNVPKDGKMQPQNQEVLIVSLTVFLGFFTLGSGFMYGTTAAGWIGASSYLIELTSHFSEFILYQTGFVILAAMIVYMTLGEQLSSGWHILLALFVSIILIPIFGHWSASSDFIARNPGWLELTGFIDQAGSVRINVVAACFAFIIALKLGRSRQQEEDSGACNNPAYSSSAVLLLWLSWLSFTTGSLDVSEGEISNIMLNVSLAASAGGLTAFLQESLNFYRKKERQIVGSIGGFVAGLVAIAACAQSVSFAEAIVIGSCAGILQTIAYKLLRKFFLKQAWQTRAAHLFSIHGVGGIWGGLCVGLFATHGSFGSPNPAQLVTQFQGIMVAVVYSVLLAYTMVFILKLRKKTQPDQDQIA